MSKVITSPVKRYSGTVTLHDPLTFPQSIAFEDALESVRALGDTATLSKIRYAFLPGVLACVESWSLNGGFPERPALDTFPSTPKAPIGELIEWLIAEVSALYRDSEDVPLA